MAKASISLLCAVESSDLIEDLNIEVTLARIEANSDFDVKRSYAGAVRLAELIY